MNRRCICIRSLQWSIRTPVGSLSTANLPRSHWDWVPYFCLPATFQLSAFEVYRLTYPFAQVLRDLFLTLHQVHWLVRSPRHLFTQSDMSLDYLSSSQLDYHSSSQLPELALGLRRGFNALLGYMNKCFILVPFLTSFVATCMMEKASTWMTVAFSTKEKAFSVFILSVHTGPC